MCHSAFFTSRRLRLANGSGIGGKNSIFMFKIAETCFSSAILSGYPYANFFCTFLPLAPELRATITYTPSASWRSLGVYVAFPTMKLLVWQYRPEFERGRWDHPFTGPEELPFTGRFANSRSTWFDSVSTLVSSNLSLIKLRSSGKK